MSQKLAIASIEIKEGKNERGDWKNYIITAEDKTRVSTFDNQASNLKVGDVIDAELEVKGKYINLKSWEVVGHAELTKPTPPQESMSKSDWADKDRITRKSIERQKALELAVECAKMKGTDSIEMIMIIAKGFELYLETGKVTLIPEPHLEAKSKPLAKPTKGNLLEEPDKPSVAEIQGGKTSPQGLGTSRQDLATSPVDIVGLMESLAILEREGVKGWATNNVLSYLNNLTGQRAKTIEEVVNHLSQEQAQTFIKSVQKEIERKF